MIQLLSKDPENFPKVSMIGDLHIMEVHLCPCKWIFNTSHTFFRTPWVLTLITPHKFLSVSKRIVILLSLLKIVAGPWLLSRMIPVLPETKVWSNSWFTGQCEASESTEEKWFALNRILGTKHVDLDLATKDPSSVFLSSAIFDMMLCFLFERKWLQENVEKFTMLNKRRRYFYSSLVKLSSVNMSASGFFGVDIFDLDLGGQSWLCQTINLTQLCGFWTRVSS